MARFFIDRPIFAAFLATAMAITAMPVPRTSRHALAATCSQGVRLYSMSRPTPATRKTSVQIDARISPRQVLRPGCDHDAHQRTSSASSSTLRGRLLCPA